MSGFDKHSSFGMFHNKRLCEKLVRDITKYIKRREYGKASELLLIIVENGSISISQIWQPLIATIRGQHGESQIDALLDTIAQATKKTPPFTASMERIYNLLDQDDLTNANRATMMFIEDHGNKLAFAHGYRGMLIACMREVDVRRKYENSVFVEPCGFHVFESSRCLELRLTKDDPDLVSIFNLRHAEAHLRKALTMDPAVDMFRAFHIQVLIALGLIDQARDELELYYKDHPDIHILRMLISIDSRNPLDQQDRYLEYFEKDPYAPAEIFQTILQRIIGSIDYTTDSKLVKRVLSIVIDRIELGEYNEDISWKCFEHLLCRLKQHDLCWNLVEEALSERIVWWEGFFFSNTCSLYKELDSSSVELRNRCRNMLVSK